MSEEQYKSVLFRGVCGFIVWKVIQGLADSQQRKNGRESIAEGGEGEEEKRETEGDRVSRFVWAEIE